MDWDRVENRVVMKDIPEKVIFEWRHEGSKDVNCVDMWENGIPDRKKTIYKCRFKEEQGKSCIRNRGERQVHL